MKFSKDENSLVAGWIDRQFETNQLFPCACASFVDGRPCVCQTHVRAYKTWVATPRKRSYIGEWIEEWLSPDEILSLEGVLARASRH